MNGRRGGTERRLLNVTGIPSKTETKCQNFPLAHRATHPENTRNRRLAAAVITLHTLRASETPLNVIELFIMLR